MAWSGLIGIIREELTLKNDTPRAASILYYAKGERSFVFKRALDCLLLGHTKLQRILAEMRTFHPQSEIRLLQYRF